MEIRLNKEIEQTLITSIRRYVAENMETEIGNLQDRCSCNTAWKKSDRISTTPP